LADLIRGLLQPALCSVDSPVTIINILLHIAHVVELKAPFRLIRRGRGVVLCFQPLAMHFGTRSEVLLRIGKEVVRAGADEVGAANFRIRDGELGIATLSASPNELVSCE
jgi:hypothetical protein